MKSGNETVDGKNPPPHKFKVGMLGNDCAREHLIRHGTNIEPGGGGVTKHM